jgi:hypothetical protein
MVRRFDTLVVGGGMAGLPPCNVVVRRHQGHRLVQALDPGIMAAVPERDELGPVASEAARRVEAALHQLETDHS